MLFCKNNKLQIILNILNIFFNSVNSIVILLFTYFNKELNSSLLICLLLFSILFLLLSNKSIKKNIKIIKSSNRIR
ncbi:DUF4293 family protein [Blattabacterium cuenoti]|uniref:DUF4293 family protein n=1 Tax=Blattabacterium cuenoti TaxID=1653831 RepID=UPI001EEA6530|nr:DUF4293 family protein [Blattabacterium cuenoti]